MNSIQLASANGDAHLAWLISAAVILSLAAAARFYSLAANSAQRKKAVAAPIAMLAAGLALAAVKGQSASVAVGLLSIALLSFTIGTVSTGKELRSFYVDRAANGTSAQLPSSTANRMVWQILVSALGLLVIAFVAGTL